jgi:outer membrane protein assembly factor BamB
VLAANKQIIVFDKSYKKLWQSTLNYNVSGYGDALEEGASPYGQAPCVERTNSLYIADEGVLTAFDLKNGNARWRLPSVGVTGIFFDDHENVYVNTTSDGLDSLKFSRQIDITRKTSAVVKKIRGNTGEVLWTAELGGLLNYVSGKYMFTVQSYQPFEDEDASPYTPESGFETPPYVKIKRIDPKNGHVLWEHFQQRAPLDVQFDKNTIRLVFKKEVQVLRFFSL